MKKRLPVGIDGFESLISQNFYYIDKTGLIVELLHHWGTVNLFTRPRRFGKTLNMSMLKAFFEIGCDSSLFDGLTISQEKALCDEYMGQYPVISITLKDINSNSYQTARDMLNELIGVEADRFSFLAESTILTENEKQRFKALTRLESGRYTMDDVMLASSLKTLSALLSRHYGKKVIILIDEYDVPLDKAYQAGFYDEMVLLLRNILSNALKSNPSLYFAVLTGCLRVSKESIFTGLNNLKVNTITDSRYDEYFGFTESDVKSLLGYYDLTDRYDEVKEWYDGYRFGKISAYCPWDVINYCDEATDESYREPKNYWANSSGNTSVKRFITLADRNTRDEIESLIAGESIVKELKPELTYNELDNSIDNLWSVLFTTGYLTSQEWIGGNKYRLKIPNREIRDLFEKQVREWFREKTVSEPKKLKEFCDAVLTGDTEAVQKLLGNYLKQTISIRDTNVRLAKKENFYHGILLGLLSYPDNWSVRSNQESGDGYSDILIQDMDTDTGIVIEVKYAEEGRMEAACAEALEQIESRNYTEALYDDGVEKIIKYGIAFYKKRCKVETVVC